MENASGDLRRALDGPILGRHMLEHTRYAVEEFAELDAHNFAAPLRQIRSIHRNVIL